MTAQEQLIKYAEQLKAQSNTALKNMTPQEIMGQAFVDGICYRRDGDTRKSCRIIRQGKTIIVNNVEIGETTEVVDGRAIFGSYETTTEVMRIEL